MFWGGHVHRGLGCLHFWEFENVSSFFVYVTLNEGFLSVISKGPSSGLGVKLELSLVLFDHVRRGK